MAMFRESVLLAAALRSLMPETTRYANQQPIRGAGGKFIGEIGLPGGGSGKAALAAARAERAALKARIAEAKKAREDNPVPHMLATKLSELHDPASPHEAMAHAGGTPRAYLETYHNEPSGKLAMHARALNVRTQGDNVSQTRQIAEALHNQAHPNETPEERMRAHNELLRTEATIREAQPLKTARTPTAKLARDTVPAAQHAALQAKYDALQAEHAQLKAEHAALKAQIATPRAPKAAAAKEPFDPESGRMLKSRLNNPLDPFEAWDKLGGEAGLLRILPHEQIGLLEAMSRDPRLPPGPNLRSRTNASYARSIVERLKIARGELPPYVPRETSSKPKDNPEYVSQLKEHLDNPLDPFEAWNKLGGEAGLRTILPQEQIGILEAMSRNPRLPAGPALRGTTRRALAENIIARLKITHGEPATPKTTAPRYTGADLVPIAPGTVGHAINVYGPPEPDQLLKIYGPAQLPRALSLFSTPKLREAVDRQMTERQGTKPRSLTKRDDLIAYLTQGATAQRVTLADVAAQMQALATRWGGV